LALTIGLPAVGAQGDQALERALFELPLVAGGEAPKEAAEPLGPDRPLELNGLAGEPVLVRLGVRQSGPLRPSQFDLTLEEESSATASATFVPEGALGAGGLQSVWLVLALSPDIPPGSYDGELRFASGDRNFSVPLYLTVGTGFLRGSAIRQVLLLRQGDTPPQGEAATLAGVPSAWPESLPVTVTALDEQNGDLALDLSRLDALLDALPEEVRSTSPLPVFLTPLMDDLCERFRLKKLGATYVLTLHSLLTQLRDRATDHQATFIFVPPADDAEEDPERYALEQHLVILTETPGVNTLLPVDGLLDLKRSRQLQLLSLADGYLVAGRDGVSLLRKHGGERPVWLRVPAGDRLRSSFWAWSVGAEVVMLEGEGVEAHLLSACAAVDLHYLATAEHLVRRARASGKPAPERYAEQAQKFLDDLKAKVEQEVRESDSPEDPEARRVQADDLTTWRDALRHHVEGLARVLQ